MELFGKSISRTRLTYTVVACDMAICILFVLNAVWILQFIKKEERDEDKRIVNLSDFAVQIKNIPSADNWNQNHELLRVMLFWHITEVVKKEPQVIFNMDEKYLPGVDHSEIVSISFGEKDFRDYELLQ